MKLLRHDEVEARLAGHEAALQFSGGRDSLACLYLLRPWWPRITVLWANPGAPMPETLEQMAEIRRQVPNFIEVRGEQPAFIERYGPPSDLVPVWQSFPGDALVSRPGKSVQSALACCFANFWRPMQAVVKGMGFTLLIRGQRDAEVRRNPAAVDGAELDGVRFWLPLQDWAHEHVSEYLAAIGVRPPTYYQATRASVDCWSCTAYLDDNMGKLAYLTERHPAMASELRRHLRRVERAVRPDYQRLAALAAAAQE